MNSDTLLAVPNVSEGRDAGLIDQLAGAFSEQAELLDTHSDADHNRTVFTLAGTPAVLRQALLAGAQETVARLDMTTHVGEHPCVGALDVCPVVFPAADGEQRAATVARELAPRIAEANGLPVFLYGRLASAPERRERAFFRRGGVVELARRLQAGELRPDFGPERIHPSAGAVLVTARPPLVAFNLELDTGDVELARAVAAQLRESGGGLPGVRAIGLGLSSGRAQISTNVHDPFAVPLAEVVERTAALAGALGARPVAAELVGLAPRAAFDGFPAELPIPGFDPRWHLIEARLGGR
ncbi:MAG: glutamate formimidoyltransferase [Solirubrobacterales bacterium]